jgi:outer membrane protein assembly factor BamC
MAPHRIVRHSVWLAAMIALAGCSSIDSLLEGDKLNYKSAGKAPTLEVPPDLSQLQRDNRYTLPENNRGVATASGYRPQAVGDSPASVIGTKPTADARIERAGTQRWLAIRQTPEALWPQIKEFWQDSGFLINLESQEAGIMETDWAENRAKIPQDFIRAAIGKALDALYSTSERDKFRTRLERGTDGTTEIFISHRGAQEVLVGQDKASTIWTPRAADPELEAEFLSRLMARLGSSEVTAKAAVQNAPLPPPRAKLVKNAGGARLEIDEGFERAWRRVGLALDRVGFTVEDRDRSKGIFFVRYLDQGQDAQSTTANKGFFSNLFSFGGNDKPKTAQRYQILVKAADASGSQATILDNEGRQDSSAAADRILALLNDQLK